MACPAVLRQIFDDAGGVGGPVAPAFSGAACKDAAALSKQLHILNLRSSSVGSAHRVGGAAVADEGGSSPPETPPPAPPETSTSCAMAMDAGVWSRLPEDIFDRIFLKLPARSHFKFRAVCRAWLAALASPRFLRQWAAGAATAGATDPAPLFLLPRSSRFQHQVPEVQPAAGTGSRHLRWLDLSFLPDSCKVSKICHLHRGLICLRTIASAHDDAGGEGTMALLVCNPLTRTFKALPEVAMHDTRAWTVAIVDSSGGGDCALAEDDFKVVLLISDTDAQDDKFWTIRVYHHRATTTSSTAAATWRVTRTRSFCPLRFLSSSLLRDGLMYTSLFHGHLLLYDTRDGALLRAAHVHMPAAAADDDYQLVQHSGSGDVYLLAQQQLPQQVHEEDDQLSLPAAAALPEESDDTAAGAPTTACFGVWKLDPSGSSWVQVSALPDALGARLVAGLSRGWDLRDCTGVELVDAAVVGDTIFINVDMHNNVAPPGANYRTQALAFHLPTVAWRIFYRGFVRGDPPYVLEPSFHLFL